VNGLTSDTPLIATAWYGDDTLIDVSPNSLEVKVSNTLGAKTNYATHDAYVLAQGGGSDAAHSCTGCPSSPSRPSAI
jgi:hypothetical protein